MLASELKKGSAPFLILALLDVQPLHGYEISKLLEQRSGGVVRFHAASLYPLLYRLEREELIEGRWVEKAGQRRRRYYRLTAAGQRHLRTQKLEWVEFVKAIGSVAGVKYA